MVLMAPETKDMMDTLIADMEKVWKKLDLPLNGTSCAEVVLLFYFNFYVLLVLKKT